MNEVEKEIHVPVDRNTSQSDRVLPIADVRAHLEEIMDHGDTRGRARLDRSSFYRYKQDLPAVRLEAKEKFRRGERVSLLTIGVGNGEEPLSYLSALHVEAQEAQRTLSDSVDLHLVDLRPRQEIRPRYGWGKTRGGLGPAFTIPEEMQDEPEIARQPPAGLESAFTYEPDSEQYVFHQDIREIFQRSMDDPAKGHFAMPVENYIAQDADKGYDIVACNNVLQHMGGSEGYASPYKNPRLSQEKYAQYAWTLRGILNRVRPGGILILHTDGADMTDTKGKATPTALALIPEFFEQFERIKQGIYRRKV